MECRDIRLTTEDSMFAFHLIFSREQITKDSRMVFFKNHLSK